MKCRLTVTTTQLEREFLSMVAAHMGLGISEYIRQLLDTHIAEVAQRRRMGEEPCVSFEGHRE